MVKQVGLLPAGCQPWNNDVVAASGDRFVYCATLAIYIYQVSTCYGEIFVVIAHYVCPNHLSKRKERAREIRTLVLGLVRYVISVILKNNNLVMFT